MSIWRVKGRSCMHEAWMRALILRLWILEEVGWWFQRSVYSQTSEKVLIGPQSSLCAVSPVWRRLGTSQKKVWLQACYTCWLFHPKVSVSKIKGLRQVLPYSAARTIFQLLRNSRVCKKECGYKHVTPVDCFIRKFLLVKLRVCVRCYLAVQLAESFSFWEILEFVNQDLESFTVLLHLKTEYNRNQNVLFARLC